MKLNKPVNYYMRSLHRDIGFFVIGLTIIYCISGIMLIYRDTGFLKQVRLIERQLPLNTNEHKLGRILHIRDFKVLKQDNEIVYFQNGTYNKTTGIAKYSAETLPIILEKFNKLHKLPSKKITHLFSLIYCILLLFLAVSSLFIYKPKTRLFHRGINITIAGFICAIILLFI